MPKEEDDKLDSKRGQNPSPEERADVVIKQLEEFIRNSREKSIGGMSFTEWQAMAKAEICDAIKDAERAVYFEDRMINRLLITAASALVTIGFWGAAMSLDKSLELTASAITAVAGFTLFAVAFEWGARHVSKRMAAKRRAKAWNRVMNVDRRIKRMRRDIEERAEEMEEKLEKMTKLNKVMN